MYPMIPHMNSFSLRPSPAPFALPLALLLLIDPALDVPLLAGTDGQGARRDRFANCRAAAHVRALADGDRRHELRVAADEGAILDHGLMFFLAVVVARDRSGADVHVRADGRVAEIRQMHRLRSRPEHCFLELDEVADASAIAH